MQTLLYCLSALLLFASTPDNTEAELRRFTYLMLGSFVIVAAVWLIVWLRRRR
jgi:hypothetical protein